MPPSSRSGIIGWVVDRLGGVLRKQPYVSAAATTALLVVMWSNARAVADDSQSRSWLNWVAVGVSLYAAVVAVYFVPRMLRNRAATRPSDEKVALMRWAFALAPFLFGQAAYLGGGDAWAIGVGLLSSVSLLVFSARAIRASV